MGKPEKIRKMISRNMVPCTEREINNKKYMLTVSVVQKIVRSDCEKMVALFTL